MEKIKAPFTPEQVENLNKYQASGSFHPFTCNGKDIDECLRTEAYDRRLSGEFVEYTPENEGMLIATEEGWICPCGKYKQDWA